MNFGQMLHYTNRFKDIVASNNSVKNDRIDSLMSDIDHVFDCFGENPDHYAVQIYCTVAVERTY
ncbi:hypothetical protein [Metabacillus fastidiosus]|uniref:hypothetical protein n=1 Tax=Metabacillus fastidiosus TaxID=1458 RepID=UPI003D2AC27A